MSATRPAAAAGRVEEDGSLWRATATPGGVLVRGRPGEPGPFDLAEVNRWLAALGGTEK
jgi:hypothetical protein